MSPSSNPVRLALAISQSKNLTNGEAVAAIHTALDKTASVFELCLTELKKLTLDSSPTTLQTCLSLAKPYALDIYLADDSEAQQLNLTHRHKDYATNILSFSAELPETLYQSLPNLPLGELVICPSVVIKEANDQHKTITNHSLHLVVHGILHLFGFDHELSHTDAKQMETLEVNILAQLDITNPYLDIDA